jgi:hypothetical protein
MPAVTTTSSSNGQLGSLYVSHGDQSDQSPRPTAANPVEIATFFNTYFASVFSSENLPDETSGPPVLTELTLTELEVETILNSLNTNKATGPDEIPARLLKNTAAKVAPSLCRLLNISLQHGIIVPRDWKLANVVPVYKKNNREHAESYRPISLLPIVSKVLERCIFLT